MKRLYVILYLLLFPCLFLAAQEEEGDKRSFLISSGMDVAMFTLKGDAAWDRFHLYSAQTMGTFRIPIEDSPNKYALLSLGYKRPFVARIDELDGGTYNVDTGSDAGFFGIYTYTGFLIENKFLFWDVLYSVGPALDVYTGDGRYLVALSLEAKGNMIIPMNDLFSSGIELAVGYDYWGINNMGDAQRYNGEIFNGLGVQANAFIAISY